MNKLFLILFFPFNLFAQSIITQWPGVEEQSQPNAKITKIELTQQYTIVFMTFKNVEKQSLQQQQLEEMFKRFRGFEGELKRGQSEINFDPKSKLIAGKKRFSFIKAVGIPTDEKRNIANGEKVSFKVYFERLDAGIETFDLYEGKDNGTLTFWNFYGIHIRNPKDNQSIASASVVPDQPTKLFNLLTFKATLKDALTKQNIVGQVVCRPGFRKNQDSIITHNDGSFKLALKTGQRYVLLLSANGYTTLLDSLFLQDDKAGVFEKSFMLNPLVEGEKTILKNIYFKTSESVLLPESFQELDKLAQQMTDKPTMQIRIEGHTDAVGDPTANLELSLARANAVKQYLIDKAIAPDRIQTKGYGSTKPLVRVGEARQQNRRVEFVIINP